MSLIYLSDCSLVEVDEIDYIWLVGFRWTCNTKRPACKTYATRSFKKTTIYLHREVAERMGLSLEVETDHIDQNKRNCKRSNLREASRSQNMMNRDKFKNNKCGQKGIWLNDSGNYRVEIVVNKRRIPLGTYSSFSLAKEIYLQASKKYFKEFSPV